MVTELRASLKYVVYREKVFDFSKRQEVNLIKGRGFEFFVNGAKSEKEHLEITSNFAQFMSMNGFHCDIFGNGTWEDNLKLKNTKDYEYVYIAIKDVKEIEEVKELYVEWKNKNKRGK